MANLLIVSLNRNTTPWSVDIDQREHKNEVPTNKHGQNIVFQFHDDLQDACFTDSAHPNPDFVWMNLPGEGIFSGPWVGGGKKQLILNDLNDNRPGTWIYRLGILVAGKEYRTVYADPKATSAPRILVTTNPAIINR